MYASSGIVSATKFFGDGSGLENVGVSTGDINSNRITTGTLNVTGISTLTGQVGFGTHITLPDNAKAKFGTGGDLEIYHDGSNSYISDSGTGALTIEASTL